MNRNILQNYPKVYRALTRFVGVFNDAKHKGPDSFVFKPNFMLCTASLLLGLFRFT